MFTVTDPRPRYAYDGENEHEYVWFNGNYYRANTGHLNYVRVYPGDLPIALEWELLNDELVVSIEPRLTDDEATIVRQNMMDDPTYRGYCGNNIARNAIGGCSNPRTIRLSGGQSKCPECGWVSEYPKEFIDRYKAKHNL